MNKPEMLYLKMFNQSKKSFLCWFIVGFFFSVLFHFFVFKKIGILEISSFNPASFDDIIPRKFHLERVKIDSGLLEEKENKKVTSLPQPVEITSKEKIDFSSQHSLPLREVKPQLLENENLMEEKKEALLENNIVPENVQRPNQPLLPFDSTTKESSIDDLVSAMTNSNANGYSQLDKLIEEKKPLSSQTAPILLPTDLLFEYDADRLKEDAEPSLKKLALLIQRNPKAQFIVEGFTDSFGSDEYNLNLSYRRANSIKEWLINKEFINPNQIQSYGLGKTHFIVPSSGTIQQQSLNRRVEIVIRQKP